MIVTNLIMALVALIILILLAAVSFLFWLTLTRIRSYKEYQRRHNKKKKLKTKPKPQRKIDFYPHREGFYYCLGLWVPGRRRAHLRVLWRLRMAPCLGERNGS